MSDLKKWMRILRSTSVGEVPALARDLVASCPQFAGSDGELIPEFNEILRRPRKGTSDLAHAHSAFCTAAVLYEIGELRGMLPNHSAPVRLSWDGLNMDAKKWCILLVGLKLPVDKPETLLRMLAAKGFVAALIPCNPPKTKRTVIGSERDIILDIPVDE